MLFRTTALNSDLAAFHHFSSLKAWLIVVGIIGRVERLRHIRVMGFVILFFEWVCILWWLIGGLGGGEGEGGGVGYVD